MFKKNILASHAKLLVLKLQEEDKFAKNVMVLDTLMKRVNKLKSLMFSYKKDS